MPPDHDQTSVSVVIRPSRMGDVEALAVMRHQLWPDSSIEKHMNEVEAIALGRPKSSLPLDCFVAERAGTLIGFVEVGLRSHADGCDPSRPCGFLEGWFVRPEDIGKGVARLLVLRAELWAREQGCSEIASDTWADNSQGQKAHEAMGYEVVDRCVNYRKSLIESETS